MATSKRLALIIGLFVVSVGVASGGDTAADHGAACVAQGDLHRSSSSLVQKHLVKARIEPGQVSSELALVNVSGEEKLINVQQPLSQAGSDVKPSLKPLLDGIGAKKLLGDAEAAATSDNLTEDALRHGSTAQTGPEQAAGEDNALNLTEGAIAGVDKDAMHMSSKAMEAVGNAAKSAVMPSDSGHESNVAPSASEAKTATNASDEGKNSNSEDSEPTQKTDDSGESSSWSDLDTGFKDLNKFLRGKPQVLSILFMMMLPAGMCAVMCCVFNIIRIMEDGDKGRDDASLGVAGSTESRPTLGEVMQTSGSRGGSYEPLCAELLAPGENECLIALPSVNEVGPGVSTFERMILSKTGQPIVVARIAVSRMSDGMPDVAGGGSCGVPGQMLERISLIAYKRKNALGFCELKVPNGGMSAARPLKCCIYRPTGDLFATLEEESTGVVSLLKAASSSNAPPHGSAYGSKCYMLTTVATGTRFWIQGDIKARSLVVVSETDEQKPIITVDTGEDLQFKSEESNYYRLRVQPKADAGVVIMALLAMDRLRASHS